MLSGQLLQQLLRDEVKEVEGQRLGETETGTEWHRHRDINKSHTDRKQAACTGSRQAGTCRQAGTDMQAGRQAGTDWQTGRQWQAGRHWQAGRQTGRQAGQQAGTGRLAGRQAGRQAAGTDRPAGRPAGRQERASMQASRILAGSSPVDPCFGTTMLSMISMLSACLSVSASGCLKLDGTGRQLEFSQGRPRLRDLNAVHADAAPSAWRRTGRRAGGLASRILTGCEDLERHRHRDRDKRVRERQKEGRRASRILKVSALRMRLRDWHADAAPGPISGLEPGATDSVSDSPSASVSASVSAPGLEYPPPSP